MIQAGGIIFGFNIVSSIDPLGIIFIFRSIRYVLHSVDWIGSSKCKRRILSKTIITIFYWKTVASSQFENKGKKRGGGDSLEPSELENCWVIEDRHRLKQKKKRKNKNKKRKGKREKIRKHENISSLKPYLVRWSF